jgi:MFS family permease
VSDNDAGLLGGVLLISGIIGLLILPGLSDKLFTAKKTYARKLFMVLSFLVATPACLLAAITSNLTVTYVLMAVLGFFLLSAFAIAMQWVAEGTAPIPESQSNNLLMYMGQIGGILFIWLVPVLFSSYYTVNIQGTPTELVMYSNAMYMAMAFMIICLVLVIFVLRDKKR